MAATTKGSTTQATQVTYELHSLGWKAFQQLCTTVLSEVWGQTVQGFFDSKDGGRDGAFYGVWNSHEGETYFGSFTAQCKFSAKPNYSIKLNDLRDDFEKAKRLAARGFADNYFLLTNAQLTGANYEKLQAAFEEIPRIKKFAAFGVERISQFIQESARLRLLVPRVYGLGDLSQILDERAYAQARELLSALGDDLSKFVITGAYVQAARALDKHGIVMLLGEPACGKSTIAAALALGALDKWGCHTVKPRHADEFVSHWNPNDPKQFFWIDDAFGATQIDAQATFAWNKALPNLQAALRRGARVVFTSRDYIYKNALDFLKLTALPVLSEAQVVIRVEQLTAEEREQILYNHIRLGTQSREFKQKLKPLLPRASAHQRFSPETARRLGDPLFTTQLILSAEGLDRFVGNPMDFLREVIRTLDPGSLSAIALVFMRGGALPSPIQLNSEELASIAMLGGTEGGVRKALTALGGSLLINVLENGETIWRFKHPTLRDAFAGIVSESQELLSIYLAGTPLRKLFGEISCGDMKIEGVKVIVPKSSYPLLIGRIGGFLTESRENKDDVNDFLARRCDETFLENFLVDQPGYLAGLHVNTYFYAVSDVDVICRLNEARLLPDVERVRHVQLISQLAVETPDAGFLRPKIRALFLPVELDRLLSDMRERVLLRIGSAVNSLRHEFRGKQSPADHFSELNSTLELLREPFVQDASALKQIEFGIGAINDAVQELEEDYFAGSGHRDYELGKVQQTTRSDGERSIFDDVDE